MIETKRYFSDFFKIPYYQNLLIILHLIYLVCFIIIELYNFYFNQGIILRKIVSKELNFVGII